MPKKSVGIVNVYGKMRHDVRLTNNGKGQVDRAKEPRQDTHDREQDGKGKTYHEVTMEKGPKRKHDKKRNLKAIVTPPGSPDHGPIGEVPEPEAQNATPPKLAGLS